MTDRPTYAALVAAIGQALYGTTWAEHLSREAGLAKRGVERVKAAAIAGEDHGAAKGYLDRLGPLIQRRRQQLDQLELQLAEAITRRAAERVDRD